MTGDAATTRFYEREATAYAAATSALDMSSDYARFLPRVRPGGLILDAGCGSGRDAKAFLDQGFAVAAFDASEALCALSSRLTGQRTELRRFADIDERDRYDGVWASASLLHLADDALVDAWDRLIRSLSPGGAIYASFKLGTGAAVGSDGRRFFLRSSDELTHLTHRHDLVDVDVAVSPSIDGRTDDWLSVVATRPGDGRF